MSFHASHPSVDKCIACVFGTESALIPVGHQMVILILVPNAWQVDNNRNTGTLENLSFTDSRALKNRGGSTGATRKYDQLACFDHLECIIFGIGAEQWVASDFNPDSFFILLIKEHAYNLGLNQDMQVWMFTILKPRVEVTRRCILAFSLRRDEAMYAPHRVDGVHIGPIGCLFPAQLFSCANVLSLYFGGIIRSARHMNWTAMTMVLILIVLGVFYRTIAATTIL